MRSYRAGFIPQRDHRPGGTSSHHTADSGRKDGDRISATSLGIGPDLGINLASPAPQAATLRRPSPIRSTGPKGGRS